MKLVTCVVADDFSSDRFLYAKMLSDLGHEVVATASNGNELIDKVLDHRPDFVLTDIGMPLKDGIEASRHIKEHIAKSTRIICITGEDIMPNTFEIAKSHINGYLLKGFHSLKLGQALKSVFSGRFFIDPKLHRKVAQLFDFDDIPEILGNLKENSDSVIIEQDGKKIKISDRQVLIVSALFHSKRKEEIAQMLFIEPESVVQNIKRLKVKLNANDRMELIRIFIEYGLIDNVQLVNSGTLFNNISNPPAE